MHGNEGEYFHVIKHFRWGCSVAVVKRAACLRDDGGAHLAVTTVDERRGNGSGHGGRFGHGLNEGRGGGNLMCLF